MRGAKARLRGAIADTEFLQEAAAFKKDYLEERAGKRDGFFEAGAGAVVDEYDRAMGAVDTTLRQLDDPGSIRKFLAESNRTWSRAFCKRGP